MIKRYIFSWLCLIGIIFFPMLLLFLGPGGLDGIQESRHKDSSLEYQGIFLRQFNKEGFLHYRIKADILREDLYNMWQFIEPRVDIILSGKGSGMWRVSSKEAFVDAEKIHFLDNVNLQDRKACPISIFSEDFLYQIKSSIFKVNGAVSYLHARQKIQASEATGSLISGKINLTNGVSSYNSQGQDCK